MLSSFRVAAKVPGMSAFAGTAPPDYTAVHDPVNDEWTSFLKTKYFDFVALIRAR
jgi:hypothetical protein